MNELENNTLTKKKVEKPKPWIVVAHNDDFTPMDFVVTLFTEVFKLTSDEAHNVMMAVHMDGKAVVCTLPAEIAETRVRVALAIAREEQHPFFLEALPQ